MLVCLNDNDNIKYGVILQITIDNSKNCLIFSLFGYNQFFNADFCVTFAERNMFEQTHERVNIRGCQIVNLCGMTLLLIRKEIVCLYCTLLLMRDFVALIVYHV